MSDYIEKALRALKKCDEALEKANLLNDYLEGIHNETPKPSEMLEEGYA